MVVACAQWWTEPAEEGVSCSKMMHVRGRCGSDDKM